MAVSQSGFHNIASPFVNGMAITLPPIPIQQQERDVVYVSNKYISTDITIIQPAFSKGSCCRSHQDGEARYHEHDEHEHTNLKKIRSPG